MVLIVCHGWRAAYAPREQRPSALASFPRDVLGWFVFSQTNELRVPEMIIARPFQELELSNEHRLPATGIPPSWPS